MPYTYLTHAYCPYCKTWIHKSLILQQEGRKMCPICNTHRVRMKAKCKKGRGFDVNFDYYKLPDPEKLQVKVPAKLICKVR